MIDVIIPNWNGRKFLATCLESLRAQTCQTFQVIIVDNGSTDDSIHFVQEHYSDMVLKIIEFPDNRGFSAAVNEGIRAGINEWVLLLNNDVEVDGTCLENLLEAISKKDGYDFFALKMLDFTDRSKLDGAGDAVLRGGVGYRLGTMETDSSYYSISRDVFGACAGAALYRRSLFEQIGLFDEDFFAYLEDVDFNLRAVRAAKRCCYLPDAKIFHIGSGSSGSKINSFTVRLTTRNNVYVVLKNYGPLLFALSLPALVIYQFFWLLFVVKKRQFRPYLQGLIQSIPGVVKMYRRYKQTHRFTKGSGYSFYRRLVAAERQAIHSIMNRRKQQGKDNRIFHVYLKLFC